jgi:hypothetical protein
MKKQEFQQHEFEMACHDAVLDNKKFEVKHEDDTIDVSVDQAKDVMIMLDILNLEGKAKFRTRTYPEQIEIAELFMEGDKKSPAKGKKPKAK